MLEKIRRAYSLEDLKSEEKGVVEGYAAVFNQKASVGGYFMEKISQRAFDNADLSDVLLLVNHDIGRIPLARSRRNTKNSTLQLGIDSRGMKIRTSLDIENNHEAKSVYSAIERGDMTGMSFLMEVRSDEWEGLDTDTPTRTITEVGKVYEVSVVNFPVYDGTEINARSEDALVNEKRALANARSSALENEKSLELAKSKALFKIRNTKS